MQVSADGRVLATAAHHDGKRRIIVWDALTLKPLAGAVLPPTWALTADGKRLVSHDAGVLTVLDASTGKEISSRRVGPADIVERSLSLGGQTLLLTHDVTVVLGEGREHRRRWTMFWDIPSVLRAESP
jgi:hypothetical protein